MKTISKNQSNLITSPIVQIDDSSQNTNSTYGNPSDQQLNEQSSDAAGADAPIKSLICFSHLRWNFVFQRPQHLMTRAAKQWNVFFVEEPVFSDSQQTATFSERNENNLWIITPQFPAALSETETKDQLENMLTTLVQKYQITDYAAWYYTPMALAFSQKLTPKVIVYDCMDELSAFKGAPVELLEWEKKLLQKADLVYTGGLSLYEAKRERHPYVHAFPSSIDKEHFAKAHTATEPADQATIDAPKFGFYGVIDERFDIELLRGLSSRRPDWHFIIIGPVVKIDARTLPQNPNIHYLGMKSYEELPAYLGGWDVALLLFARNESTRFISPTKTPEYLAAHKPVVSTPITDVIRPYGQAGLVHIAESAEEFEQAIEKALGEAGNTEWQQKVDTFLAHNSWNHTWQQMQQLMTKQAETKASS